MNLLLTKMEKSERSRDEGAVEYWEISLGHITLDMPVRHVGAKQVVEYYVWSSG